MEDKKPEKISEEDRKKLIVWVSASVVMFVIVIIWILNLDNFFVSNKKIIDTNDSDLSSLREELGGQFDDIKSELGKLKELKDISEELSIDEIKPAKDGISAEAVSDDVESSERIIIATGTAEETDIFFPQPSASSSPSMDAPSLNKE